MQPMRCVCGARPNIAELDVGTVYVMCSDTQCSAATPECDSATQAVRVWQAMQSEAHRDHIDT